MGMRCHKPVTSFAIRVCDVGRFNHQGEWSQDARSAVCFIRHHFEISLCPRPQR